MCSHGYFYRGNEKQTRTTLKNINLVLFTNVSFIKSTVYDSYILLSTAPRFFSGERRGRLFQISSLRRGPNSKRGANSSIYGILSMR